MWLARIWFLLVLCLAAVLLSGALTLPGFRDEQVAALRARQAEIEALAVQAAVAAEVEALGRTARLAATDPDLSRTLASITTDMPPHVARTLLDRSLNQLAERTGVVGLVLVAADGTVRGASSRLAVDAAGLARLPLVKSAQGGGPKLALSEADRALAAMPLPAPPPGAVSPEAPSPVAPGGSLPSGGVVVVATRTPSAAALAAHAALKSDGRLLVLVGDDAEGTLPPEARAAATGASRESALPLTIEGTPSLARRFPLAAVPGADLVLSWPVMPAATFSEAGGITGLFDRALARGPETGVLLGAVLVLWLLGVLVGEAVQRRAVRRVAAEVETIAEGPKPVPVELAEVPAWLRPLVAAANEAALEARRKAPKAEARAADSGEISAERVLRDAVADGERSEDARGGPRTPAARPTTARPSSVAPHPSTPSDPPEHFLTSRPPSEGTAEAELVPGEGTAELPGRRVGAAPRERLLSVPGWPRGSDAPEEITREVGPRRSFDRLGPVEIDDDDDNTADRTRDARPAARRPTTPPPVEDAELSADEAGGSVFDLSLPGASPRERWLSEPPDAGGAEPSMQVPGAGKKASLLSQLRSRSALDPAPRPPDEGPAGDSTVVRPIPLNLLDASAGKDADQTAVGPPPGRPERDQVERAFEQVFEEFLTIKRTCGEPTHTVDYARFRAKLVRTRKSLMERFGCADVRFRVYVKDGRAALKAAPIIDGNEGEETLG